MEKTEKNETRKILETYYYILYIISFFVLLKIMMFTLKIQYSLI